MTVDNHNKSHFKCYIMHSPHAQRLLCIPEMLKSCKITNPMLSKSSSHTSVCCTVFGSFLFLNQTITKILNTEPPENKLCSSLKLNFLKTLYEHTSLITNFHILNLSKGQMLQKFILKKLLQSFHQYEYKYLNPQKSVTVIVINLYYI